MLSDVTFKPQVEHGSVKLLDADKYIEIDSYGTLLLVRN